MKKFNLLLTIWTLIGIFTIGYAQDIKSDLVAYFPLDGNAISGLEDGIEGELKGNAVATEGIWEKEDGAVKITSVGDAITMSDDEIDLPMEDTERSMSIWYKPDENLEVAYLISYGTPSDESKGGHMHFAYRRNDGVIRIGHWYADYDFVVDDLADGEWHHFAFTFDGEWFVCYLDGEIVGEQEVDPDLAEVYTISNGQLALGARNHVDLNDPAIGSIDEARIYARTLTEEEIVKIYELDPDNLTHVDQAKLSPISVSPNPAKNKVNINTKEAVESVIFFDLSGREVLKSKSKSIDISGLNSGIYSIKIKTEGRVFTSKVIRK